MSETTGFYILLAVGAICMTAIICCIIIGCAIESKAKIEKGLHEIKVGFTKQ